MIWKTIDGRNIHIDDIKHEHISNIYHYDKLFNFQLNMPTNMKKLLDGKFKGEILPYSPKITSEVYNLYINNNIILKNDHYLVILKVNKIGTINKELIKDTENMYNVKIE